MLQFLLFLISDEQAEKWKELWSQHHQMLYWTAFRILNDSFAAEDVAQEALLKYVVGHYDLKIRNPKAIRRYLQHIVSTCAADYIKKTGKAEPTENIEEFFGASEDESLLLSASVDEIVQVLPVLNEKERAVIFLRSVKDLRDRDIAHTMGMSEKTVNSHVRRARIKLQKALEVQHNAKA